MKVRSSPTAEATGDLPSLDCCAFSTATDDYVPKAVVSLLSFARHNPEVDLFILSSRLSSDSDRLCRHHGITPIELDLEAAFYECWAYPRECYYHFKAPELFHGMGYQNSIYMDGDVYCNRPFPYHLSETFHLAGASYDTLGDSFAGFKDGAVRRLFPPDDAGVLARQRVNSGVLIYNNGPLAEIGYFAEAARLFDLSIRNGVPRKGDDSLLGLMQGVCHELVAHALPKRFNYIDYKFIPAEGAVSGDELFSECVVYHFGRHKPWSPPSAVLPYYHRFFTNKWLEVMINALSDEEIISNFPSLHKPNVISAEDVHFYWYDRQLNFGDLITPYMVERLTGRKIRTPVDPQRTSAPVVLSAGSIMRLSGPTTIVWGSGIRDRHQEIAPPKVARSVRGPITRSRILEVGGECPPIYGDPALLLPRLYTPKPPAKRHKLGIVPHITQYEQVHPLYSEDPDTPVIDLRTDDIEGVVDAIAACDAVVSSSLHGIVVSNAYGVPVRWIKFDNNLFGDDTKFHDHFAAIKRPKETFIDARPYRKIPADSLLRQIEPYDLRIDLDRLWEASVFDGGEISRYTRWVFSEGSSLCGSREDGEIGH